MGEPARSAEKGESGPRGCLSDERSVESSCIHCLLCLMVLKQQPYELPPMRRCDTNRTIPQHYPRSEISELKVHCRCDFALL